MAYHVCYGQTWWMTNKYNDKRPNRQAMTSNLKILPFCGTVLTQLIYSGQKAASLTNNGKSIDTWWEEGKDLNSQEETGRAFLPATRHERQWKGPDLTQNMLVALFFYSAVSSVCDVAAWSRQATWACHAYLFLLAGTLLLGYLPAWHLQWVTNQADALWNRKKSLLRGNSPVSCAPKHVGGWRMGNRHWKKRGIEQTILCGKNMYSNPNP